MSRALLLLALSACAPMAGVGVAVPLPEGHTAGMGAGVAAALPDDSETVPPLQLHSWGTFRLSETWEAGPSFLLGLGRDGTTGPFTGGMWVRWWDRSQDPDGLQVGVRFDAGWAWLGTGLDLVLPLGSDSAFTVSPSAVLTPDFLGGRVPVGALVRLGRADAALQVGALVGTDGAGRGVLVPYGSVHLQWAF